MEKKFFIWLGIALVLKQMVWMAFIPPWQFPDEQAHFGQVQNFAENKSTAAFIGPNTSKEIVIAEELLGTRRDGLGNNRFTYHPEYKLPLNIEDANEIEASLVSLPIEYRTQKEAYEATVYPPLYYILGASIYSFVYQADIVTRIFMVRFVNIPIFLGVVFFTLKIGKLLFEKNVHLAILLTLLVGFQPMFSFVSSGTTSDNLYNLLATLTIYICLFIMKHGITAKRLFYSLLVAMFLWITKPQGKLLFLLFGVAPLFLLSHQKDKRRIWLVLFIFFALAFGYMMVNLILGRQFLPDIPGLDMVVQSKLPVLSHLRWTLTHTYREVLPWYWGVYRWLSLTYPRIIHRTINWLILFGIVGLVGYLFKKNKKQITFSRNVWFLILANAIYFLGLFVFDYLFTLSHHFSFGMQGRYYFPLIVSQMALLVVGWETLFSKSRWKNAALGLLGMLTIGLHTYAQIFVGFSYLSPTSTSEFFMQLGLYKPWFFKNPYLPLLFSAYFSSLIVLVWYYVCIWRQHEKNRT